MTVPEDLSLVQAQLWAMRPGGIAPRTPRRDALQIMAWMLSMGLVGLERRDGALTGVQHAGRRQLLRADVGQVEVMVAQGPARRILWDELEQVVALGAGELGLSGDLWVTQLAQDTGVPTRLFSVMGALGDLEISELIQRARRADVHALQVTGNAGVTCVPDTDLGERALNHAAVRALLVSPTSRRTYSIAAGGVSVHP